MVGRVGRMGGLALLAATAGVLWAAAPSGAGPSTANPPGAGAALAKINQVRRAAALKPVELDPLISRGCQAHARYLDRNQTHPAARGLGMHQELASLPGFSLEGEAAGMMSVIARRDSLSEAVDAFLATLYHRVPLLRPSLQRVGMGFAGRTAVINVQTGWKAMIRTPSLIPLPRPAKPRWRFRGSCRIRFRRAPRVRPASR